VGNSGCDPAVNHRHPGSEDPPSKNPRQCRRPASLIDAGVSSPPFPPPSRSATLADPNTPATVVRPPPEAPALPSCAAVQTRPGTDGSTPPQTPPSPARLRRSDTSPGTAPVPAGSDAPRWPRAFPPPPGGSLRALPHPGPPP